MSMALAESLALVPQYPCPPLAELICALGLTLYTSCRMMPLTAPAIHSLPPMAYPLRPFPLLCLWGQSYGR